MDFLRWTSILVYIVLIVDGVQTGQQRFTNLECQVFDPSYGIVKLCRLNVIRRGVIAMNIRVALHKKVVKDKINAVLYRKFNGFRPFLLNYTFEVCASLRSKSNPFIQFFMPLLKPYTNCNHTCPYEHEIIFKNVIIDEEYFRFAPIPTGDYKLSIKHYVNNGNLTGAVHCYFNRIE